MPYTQIDFAPLAAAVGATVRVVGAGFTGTASVKFAVGPTVRIACAFTVHSDTDLLVTVPSLRYAPTDTWSGTAHFLIDDVYAFAMYVGTAGDWQSGATLTDRTLLNQGATGGGGGAGDTFTEAVANVPLGDPDSAILGAAAVIGRRIDTFIPVDQFPEGQGQWKVQQQIRIFNFALMLLVALPWEGTLPDGAGAAEIDLSGADIGAWLTADPTVEFFIRGVPYPSPPGPTGGTYAISSDGTTTVELDLLSDDDWPATSAPSLNIGAVTDFSGVTNVFSTAVADSTTVTADDSITRTTYFGDYYHSPGFAVLFAATPEVTGVEPSWPVIDFYEAGYVSANLDFTVTAPSLHLPRWRPLFRLPPRPTVLPPLRTFPRDDAVGGSPRTDRSSTSRQSSARQGFTNTYR